MLDLRRAQSSGEWPGVRVTFLRFEVAAGAGIKLLEEDEEALAVAVGAPPTPGGAVWREVDGGGIKLDEAGDGAARVALVGAARDAPLLPLPVPKTSRNACTLLELELELEPDDGDAALPGRVAFVGPETVKAGGFACDPELNPAVSRELEALCAE